MSTIRVVTIIILSLILVAIFSYFLLTYLLYFLTLRKGAWIGKYVKKVFHENEDLYKINPDWWNTQKVEKFQIENDGLKLSGFYIKNPNIKTSKLAIILHGYYSDHRDMNIQANLFLEKGFNVFCPDSRAHGESQGKTISMGYFEKSDLKKWVEFLTNKFGKELQIAIFGWSMGAAIANLYCSGDVASNVKCVISDCSYNNAYEEFKCMLKQRKLPSGLAMFLLNQGAKMYGEFYLKEVDIESVIKFNKVPTLFIHGEKDSFVPCYMSEKLFNSKEKGYKKLVKFANAEHCMSYASDKERYVNIITEFISGYFK